MIDNNDNQKIVMDTIYMVHARYKQFVDILAADIRAGVLTAGTKLPTHRQFAKQHGLALVTATRVYSELEAMGLVIGEVGRGTFVREMLLPADLGINQEATALDMVDLNFNYPALEEQAELLRQALRQLATAGNLEALLRYQPHGGNLHERACIARYLESSALTVDATQLFIVNGAQHGLAVAVLALLQPGDVLVVDALTYPGIKVLAQIHHIELVAIPITPQSSDLKELEVLCKNRRVRAVYTMPTLHNPLGWVTCLNWREKLVMLARQYGFFIIEDAAYAFLVEDAPPSLVTLAPELTVYVSGFSKSIATGLRVGFVVTPPQWQSAIEKAIRATTWNTAGIMTALVCQWLENGTALQLVVNKREDAKQRQHIAREILAEFQYISHPCSYFLWLPLGEEVRAEQITAALLKKRISVSTAIPFATTQAIPHAIRLALGSVPIDVLKDTLQTVKSVIKHYSY